MNSDTIKIIALCDFAYWEKTSGTSVRYDSLCRSLNTVCDLTVVSTETVHRAHANFFDDVPYKFLDRRALKAVYSTLSSRDIIKTHPSRQMVISAINRLTLGGAFDAVLTPYFNRRWMLQSLPDRLVRVIDTHDCQSQRARSLKRHGLLPTFMMTEEDEGRELENYDIALALSMDDYLEFSNMSSTPVIVAPFRLPIREIYRSRNDGKDLLFVAAKSPVNDMTLQYLVEDILPLIQTRCRLHIVGDVTVPDRSSTKTELVIHNHVPRMEDIYSSVDLALNPTFAGGGVKTKTLESICFGMPVVTSDEGARGLNHLIPSELIANNKFAFAHKIDSLLASRRRRQAISKQLIRNLASERREDWLEPFSHLVRACRQKKAEMQ